MTVTYKEYIEEKKAFFQKHNCTFSEYTSPMDEYGRYYKAYNFEDGAQWFESMSFAPVEAEVKMFKTEYWNTDNATSKFYYEKF